MKIENPTPCQPGDMADCSNWDHAAKCINSHAAMVEAFKVIKAAVKAAEKVTE